MDAKIRVYDDRGNVIDTPEHTGDFKEPRSGLAIMQPFSGYSFYGARNRLRCNLTLVTRKNIWHINAVHRVAHSTFRIVTPWESVHGMPRLVAVQLR